jgi:tRNA(Ile2) C34 agmatinyltransferase TiaS
MVDEFDTPNCEKCLVRMEPDGEDIVAWRCPECGSIRTS